MKKFSFILFLVALTTMSFGQNLAGSAHDFTGDAWEPITTNKMCGSCHTPHNAAQATSGPLWNHDISVAAYTVYTSPFGTLDAGAMGQPSGVSLYCLSCHDGTVNVDAHADGANAQTIGGSNLVGTDLSNDHPVSFIYDAAVAASDGELFDPTTQNSGLGSTISADMLFAGSMECGSCHDVHNYANVDGGVGLLRKTNMNSELCLTCHNK